MTTHLGLQRILLPSAQVSSLTTGSITLPSARGAFVEILLGAYFAGGTNTSTTNYTSTIQKLSFPTESTSTLSATLSNNLDAAGTFSSSTAGYIAGGYLTSGVSSTIDKLIYATEVKSTLSNSLPQAQAATGTFHSSSAGYAAGGQTGSPNLTTVAKMLFSNETSSNLGTGLSLARRYCFGFYSSSDGYIMGGYSNSIVTNGDKFNLSNDSRSTFTIPVAIYGGATFVSSTFGYYAGGQADPNIISTIRKMNFSNDSFSTLSATLSSTAAVAGGTQSSVAGFVAGGSNHATVIDKITLSTDVRTTLSATLPTPIDGCKGFAQP